MYHELFRDSSFWLFLFSIDEDLAKIFGANRRTIARWRVFWNELFPRTKSWSRFSVIGSLLSTPPARGELKATMGALAEKDWAHPVTGQEVRFSAVTIERWYYKARREGDNPVGVLQRVVPKDSGKVSLAPELADHLPAQYRDHSHWTFSNHLKIAKSGIGTLITANLR